METQELTVGLPLDDLKFIERYAVEQNITVGELIRDYFAQLRCQAVDGISPRLQEITGILPQSVDLSNARRDYYEHILDKHQ